MSIGSGPRCKSVVVQNQQSLGRQSGITHHVVLFRVQCPGFRFVDSVVFGMHDFEDTSFLQNPSGKSVDEFTIAGLDSVRGEELSTMRFRRLTSLTIFRPGPELPQPNSRPSASPRYRSIRLERCSWSGERSQAQPVLPLRCSSSSCPTTRLLP